MNAGILEIAAADHFGYRRNLIVPNVSYGWNLDYEADLVIVSPSKYAMEVEIKISISDLRHDSKKKKFKVFGISKRFRQFYYLIPNTMLKYQEEIISIIPDYAGLMVAEPEYVKNHYGDKFVKKYLCRIIKVAKINKGFHKLTDKEYLKLSHLAAMRIWDLKRKNQRLTKR